MEQPPLKRIRSERSPAGSENDGTVQSRENPVDSNIYLTYDILRIVFRYLNGRDLASAAMVCRYNVHNTLICAQFNPKYMQPKRVLYLKRITYKYERRLFGFYT